MEIEKEREEIIELFGIHFESLYQIPPLAARILGVLIIDGCRSGLTFEQLIDKLSASKSSISTNLKLLLSMEKVYYFTISGDRKKYFKSASLSDRLSNYLKLIEAERNIIDKMHDYRHKSASCTEEIDNLENIISYKKHIQKIEKSFQQTIAEFKKIEIKNHNHQHIEHNNKNL
ncbi:GbsR/MarR family transcriptional regulator [Flavobacterium sp. 7A]|uniref:GbsR/MarR family transcriptional regulator n=1 Tax=Flavobacterium sp. 7A TaxID=2940571 RepID=UPI0022280664|nr:helix-turn-helix domain-containing protein [Flavobacterium sp. 7A]MCW2118393.1 DNA-binding transcriptional regulator GbsR (MarR family) [Flavobacterium sp. 7A]